MTKYLEVPVSLVQCIKVILSFKKQANTNTSSHESLETAISAACAKRCEWYELGAEIKSRLPNPNWDRNSFVPHAILKRTQASILQ